MEVPVHIHLALLFWACGIMAEQSQEQKKKIKEEEERLGGLCLFQGHELP
jgi:hypothetical protein